MITFNEEKDPITKAAERINSLFMDIHYNSKTKKFQYKKSTEHVVSNMILFNVRFNET